MKHVLIFRNLPQRNETLGWFEALGAMDFNSSDLPKMNLDNLFWFLNTSQLMKEINDCFLPLFLNEVRLKFLSVLEFQLFKSPILRNWLACNQWFDRSNLGL